MCLVFLTTSSVLWTLSSILSSTLLLSGHLTPSWLLGNPVVIRHSYPSTLHRYGNELQVVNSYGQDKVVEETVKNHEVAHDHISVWTGAQTVRPSLGLWIRCTIMAPKKGVATTQHCGVYATSGADLPAFHVVALACMVTGTGLSVLSCLMCLLCACKRNIRHKSLYCLTGAVQSLAAVFCILGLVVYPVSWASIRVKLMCGPNAGPYYSGQCDIGWALYTTIGGSVLLLLCSLYSLHVDGSVSSNRAEDEIRRGNHFLCIT